VSERVVAVRVLVSGRVQGVWYRQSCAQAARAAGVSGWVRNRADGRVEAWFEGGRSAVEAMLDWSRVGPPRARVEAVAIEDEAPTGASGFAVE
jgi:acylphosphatase